MSTTSPQVRTNVLQYAKAHALHFATVRRIRRLYWRLSKPHASENRDYNKVFCVGWVKTGTTSFGDAMKTLGFKHCSFDLDVWRKWYQKGNIDRIVRYARCFDSFDDLPWNMIDILGRLDTEFPQSKFVLLQRDSDSWFQSLQKFRKRRFGEVIADKDKKKYIGEYEERNSFVTDYFVGPKRGQLLLMNVVAGEGYEKLCPFLGLPVLNAMFPHSNKSPDPTLAVSSNGVS